MKFSLLSNNNKTENNITNDSLVLNDKNNNKFKLNRDFLEWLVGFVDAEGNFIIILRDNPRTKINIKSENIENKKIGIYTVPMRI